MLNRWAKSLVKSSSLKFIKTSRRFGVGVLFRCELEIPLFQGANSNRPAPDHRLYLLHTAQ